MSKQCTLLERLREGRRVRVRYYDANYDVEFRPTTDIVKFFLPGKKQSRKTVGVRGNDIEMSLEELSKILIEIE